MQTKIIERYFFLALLLATLTLTFFIFRPFWIVLTLAIAFSIVLYPAYLSLVRRKLPPSLASFLTVILFIIVLGLPILGIGAIVFNQTQDVYHKVIEGGNSQSLFDTIDTKVNKYLPLGMSVDVKEKSGEFLALISSNVSQILNATLSTIFAFILLLVAMFYFLRDGEKWKKTLMVLSPLADSDDEKIITRLARSVNVVIKGYILIAVAQGILASIGFALFGVPNPTLWGVVAAFASFIPTFGTSLVTVPAILFLFATGATGSAIGLAIWVTVVVSLVDNFLSPMFIGNRIDIPPLLILFAVLGGVSIFGPIGILIGPLILSLLFTLLSIYRNQFQAGS